MAAGMLASLQKLTQIDERADNCLCKRGLQAAQHASANFAFGIRAGTWVTESVSPLQLMMFVNLSSFERKGVAFNTNPWPDRGTLIM